MKTGMYLKLAVTGMARNRKVYLPYILTCTGMVMMMYIITYLAGADAVHDMRGGTTMTMILSLGRGVIGIFALFFLIYTNVFITRRRNREFGVYNILGMNKRNLARILLWETAIIGLVSAAAGLLSGILLSKLAEFGMLKCVGGAADFDMSIDIKAIAMTSICFAAIFAVILVISLGRVSLSKPIELARSENHGEKPPKANWFIAGAGAVILAAAYYIAVSIEDPFSAMTYFFTAVIMVIAATYMLFISGSVTLCRLLQKNKKYYYRPGHFVSVSSMAFRMKRNGAGLATICILCTMILVMTSSTSCLIAGGQDMLRRVYPYDYQCSLMTDNPDGFSQESIDEFEKAVDSTVPDKSLDFRFTSLEVGGYVTDEGNIVSDSSKASGGSAVSVFIMPVSVYNRYAERDIKLADDEAVVSPDGKSFDASEISIDGTETFRVRHADDFKYKVDNAVIYSKLNMFVSDSIFSDYAGEIMTVKNAEGGTLAYLCHGVFFNVKGEDSTDISGRLAASLGNAYDDMDDGYGYGLNSRLENIDDFMSLYGSLFFLGILLSIVFLFATVLIIYYKQISEGYEDRSRFEIMKNVGMTDRDIRRSVNSQVLTVFAAPIAAAAVHLGFAFPMLWQMLKFFGFTNMTYLIKTTVICFAVFAVIYALVYKLTSNAYYRILTAKAE